MLKKFINVYLYVLGKSLYILSFGMFKKQGRVSLITIATALGYYKKQHNLILPVIKSEALGIKMQAKLPWLTLALKMAIPPATSYVSSTL